MPCAGLELTFSIEPAIVSLGFSTGLGFVHTGKLLSFVYDIADLYKTETSIPAAFEAVQSHKGELDRQVRLLTRQKISKGGILKRVADDIAWVFDVPLHEEQDNLAEVGKLWNNGEEIDGGINHGGDAQWS